MAISNSLEITLAVVVITTVAILYKVFYKSESPKALNPKQEIPFRLIDIVSLSHDTKKLRFSLQSPQHILGLPIGKHIQLTAKIGERKVLRPYTPTSLDRHVGIFDLVIKIYRANEKFPEGGKMTQHLDSLKVGDIIDARGPSGKIVYEGRGQFHVEKGKMKESGFLRQEEEIIKTKRIGMIAGGTGITPMYQILLSGLTDSKDNTEFYLLYANQTEEDILMHAELDLLAKEHPNFKLHYTLDRPNKDWAYSTGFITKEMLQAHMPPCGPDTVILLCGPPAMIKLASLPNLKELGHDDSRMLEF